MTAKEKQGFGLYFLFAFGLAWLCQIGGCMALLRDGNATIYQALLVVCMLCPLAATLLVQKVWLRQPTGIGWKVQGKRWFWLAAWFGPAVLTLLGAVLYFAVFPSRLDFSGSWLVAADDMSAQYQYTKDIVSDDGKLKGTTWQATPGLFAYRRSIAKQVLGTDDPDEVQKKLGTWSDFDNVAAQMHDAGYYMLSGYDDSYRTFSNNVSGKWVQDGKIVIDPSIQKWIDQTKDYSEKGYNNRTTLWSPQWSVDQGPDGNVFGFFYSTWGINFTLMGNSLADSNAPAEAGNGIYGDYAVCEGPQAYYWGGTWICAAKGTDNVPFIHDLMYRLTCEADTMKQITLDTQDYTNNQTAMEEIAGSDYSSDFLGGQNHIALFAEAAKKIDMSNICDYDKDCNEQIQKAFHPYFEGDISYDEAMEDFYNRMKKLDPELTH